MMIQDQRSTGGLRSIPGVSRCLVGRQPAVAGIVAGIVASFTCSRTDAFNFVLQSHSFHHSFGHPENARRQMSGRRSFFLAHIISVSSTLPVRSHHCEVHGRYSTLFISEGLYSRVGASKKSLSQNLLEQHSGKDDSISSFSI